jgi:hypothetical protein
MHDTPGGTSIITQDNVLVQLIRLVEFIPTPQPPHAALAAIDQSSIGADVCRSSIAARCSVPTWVWFLRSQICLSH